MDQNLVSVAAASRRSFLRRSTAMAVAGGAAAMVGGSASGAEDRAILQGTDLPAPDTQRARFVSIRKHENDHVAFLVSALGSSARPKPTFRNLKKKNYSGFIYVSQELENTGVGAYLGAAPVLYSAAYLAAAGSILTVEARHAGYLNVLGGDPITGSATEPHTDHSFDTPLTSGQVVQAASEFIADLNGGPPVGYSDTPSPENDIAILNFALALEYLEAEYYNINVPLWFKNTGTNS